jgi:hypothetical protein
VIGALLVLHVGAALLLTRGARAAVAEVERTWSVAELAAARDPGAPPAVAGEGYAAWKRAESLWSDAQRRAERAGHARVLSIAAAGSFALQAGAVALLARRATRRRR